MMRFISLLSLAVTVMFGCFSFSALAKKNSIEHFPLLMSSDLSVASRVYLGDSYCSSQKVKVEIAPRKGDLGYFSLKTEDRNHVMKPIVTSSGTIRLEEVGGSLIWIQTINTSMLLDKRTGKMLLGDCVNRQQKATEEAIRSGKRKDLFSGAGMLTSKKP